jgi:hypothetical protein
MLIIIYNVKRHVDRPQMTECCIHIACWIPKVTNTYSEYVLLFALPLQQWLHEHASLSHMYIACLVLYIIIIQLYYLPVTFM